MTEPPVEPPDEEALHDAVRDEVRRARKLDRLVLTSWGLAVLGLAGLFSFWTQHNQQEQARKAAAVEARAAEQARAIVCRLFTTILDAYQESPPTTKAGRSQVDAWLQVYELSKCQPPRN